MRNRIVQICLSLALLALLIQVVLIAPSQIRDSETKAAILPTPEFPEAQPGVDQSMNEMHMLGIQDGRKDWEIWADTAVRITAKNLMEMKTVKAIFFSESGVTFNVTGNKGIIVQPDMTVEGDVVIRSSNGYVFRTDVMKYESVGRKISTDSPVEMIGPKDANGRSLRLTGVGMLSELEPGTMSILRDVRAEKALDNGRRALIRSQRSQFSAKDRTAKFLGEVVLDMDNMRITGPEAQFQYDSKKDAVKSVVFTGGARVSDAEKWATAQNVRVDFDTNRFVFRGSPRVMQNNDELRGEEIVFLDGGKRVIVQKARAKVDEKRLENTQ